MGNNKLYCFDNFIQMVGIRVKGGKNGDKPSTIA